MRRKRELSSTPFASTPECTLRSPMLSSTCCFAIMSSQACYSHAIHMLVKRLLVSRETYICIVLSLTSYQAIHLYSAIAIDTYICIVPMLVNQSVPYICIVVLSVSR